MTTDVAAADRALLRHMLATLAYRGGKVLRDPPANFGAFRLNDTSRSASQILAHVGDLLDWALSIMEGQQRWHDSVPGSWEQDVARFFDGLARADQHLASGGPLDCGAERLFQGPIADALTHVGQLAMLRRLAGSPVRGENYFKADIAAGRIGPEQSPPRREFD